MKIKKLSDCEEVKTEGRRFVRLSRYIWCRVGINVGGVCGHEQTEILESAYQKEVGKE